MKLIMLGAPGAGKGTQAARISEKYDIPHISTGDLLRQNIADQTELGNKVKQIVESGNLVPNELILELLKDRIQKDDAKDGYILDGYPRNLEQAEAMEGQIDYDKVLEIDVDFDTIIKRLEKRRLIEGRKDDNPETVLNRLEVYKQQTTPLTDYYSEKGCLVKINGDGDLDQIFSEIVKVL